MVHVVWVSLSRWPVRHLSWQSHVSLAIHSCSCRLSTSNHPLIPVWILLQSWFRFQEMAKTWLVRLSYCCFWWLVTAWAVSVLEPFEQRGPWRKGACDGLSQNPSRHRFAIDTATGRLADRYRILPECVPFHSSRSTNAHDHDIWCADWRTSQIPRSMLGSS